MHWERLYVLQGSNWKQYLQATQWTHGWGTATGSIKTCQFFNHSPELQHVSGVQSQCKHHHWYHYVKITKSRWSAKWPMTKSHVSWVRQLHTPFQPVPSNLFVFVFDTSRVTRVEMLSTLPEQSSKRSKRRPQAAVKSCFCRNNAATQEIDQSPLCGAGTKEFVSSRVGQKGFRPLVGLHILAVQWK